MDVIHQQNYYNTLLTSAEPPFMFLGLGVLPNAGLRALRLPIPPPKVKVPPLSPWLNNIVLLSGMPSFRGRLRPVLRGRLVLVLRARLVLFGLGIVVPR